MNTPNPTTHVSAKTRTESPRPHTSRKSIQDPVAFVEHWLGEKPWAKQRQILRALRDNRQVAVRSCNASGKTYTAALATIWWLMAHDEALVITTAPLRAAGQEHPLARGPRYLGAEQGAHRRQTDIDSP